MVEYIPIDDSEVEPEAPLISSLGVRWRDNPVAIAEGASGAPRIQQAAIDSGAVGQSQLKTATGSTSISVNMDPSSNVAVSSLPGGQYALSVETRVTNSSSGGSFAICVGSASRGNDFGYAHRICAFVTDSADVNGEGDGRVRYVQSSPPYDHGDGVISGYAYASIGSGGDVDSLYLAEDPPWYGNTQNASIDQWRDPKTGKEYQRTRKLKCCKRDVDEGRISMAEFMERAGECEDVVEEITPEVKLRGMEEMPHPFDEKEDRTVVLLDPMDEKIARLIRMMQAGENIHDLDRKSVV